ncbi:uncharacterized protein UV8b_01403 [Ustilaginoidea virens]|uniref:Swiss Army Knife RNA repair protein HAD domain-containing protein n=1 Tax=Ustilaginoidea virens TaxID=1159556 RepID=A0A8E5MEY6_USTVR|nr:uncharacterized protein UV8b_01403 [Ustilaginoidea virens]QUC17162.1 hypothetical protein UV8b_01403 [Ustilaginoidea virens]
MRTSGLLSSAMASAYSAYHGAARAAKATKAPWAPVPPDGSPFTVTALSRWSSLDKTLPAVGKIKALHVYDFDNTLFKSPVPNPAVWNGPTIGLLVTPEGFHNGGWWHDNRILAATGQGVEKEEPRAWEGWWNETVVQLARLTIKQPDALCVLLTGRSENAFADLLKRMVAAKGLDFDLVSLKPRASPSNQRFQSTMHFKQVFLNALMETYREATEIRVYEDRPKHTARFRDFFQEYNRLQGVAATRGPISAEVVQVAESSARLDPVTEVAEVQRMINLHNDTVVQQSKLKINTSVVITSYLLNDDDSKKMFNLVDIPDHVARDELKIHSDNILICLRPCPSYILDKVGGMGSKMLWKVTGTACYNNSIWAARVRPALSTARYHTDNPVPLVVLALVKGARIADAAKIAYWHPLPKGQSFEFETTVGEKVILRVDREDHPGYDQQSASAGTTSKRKHAEDEGWVARNAHGPHGGRNEPRGYHSGTRGGGPRGRGSAFRGTRGSARGGGRGAGRGGGRGKGAGYQYRSLDDVDPRNQQGWGHGPQVSYDDAYPRLHQHRSQGPPPTGPKASLGRGGSHHGGGGGREGGAGRSLASGQASNNADLESYY